MKRLFALTLCALLFSTCSFSSGDSHSRCSTMSYSVKTQVQLDQANERIYAFKQELLQQKFREVSVSVSDLKEEFILEGQYGSLRDLRVTLRTNKQLEEKEPEVSGGIEAYIRDEQARGEYHDLYQRVVSVVTGRQQ